MPLLNIRELACMGKKSVFGSVINLQESALSGVCYRWLGRRKWAQQWCYITKNHCPPAAVKTLYRAI